MESEGNQENAGKTAECWLHVCLKQVRTLFLSWEGIFFTPPPPPPNLLPRRWSHTPTVSETERSASSCSTSILKHTWVICPSGLRLFSIPDSSICARSPGNVAIHFLFSPFYRFSLWFVITKFSVRDVFFFASNCLRIMLSADLWISDPCQDEYRMYGSRLFTIWPHYRIITL